mmetsp:Transcript_44294/g.87849  ORF Transcript_44294/g.87849 Transcript_44294/m.87849 type:complete len:272 (+) Transcript_44294:85-900(+)
MEAPSDHVIVSEMPADMTEDRLKEIFGAYGTVKWCKISPGKGGKAGIFTSAILELGSVDEAQYFVTALDENIPEGLEKPIRVRYKPPSKGKPKGGFSGGYVASPRPVLVEAGETEESGEPRSHGPWRSTREARPAPYQAFSPGGKGPVFAGKGMALGSASVDAVVKMLIASGRLPGGKWTNDENTVHISGLPQDTSSNDLLRIFSPFGAIAAGGAYAQLNPDGTSKGTGIINFLDSEGAQTAITALNGTTLENGMSLRLRAFTAQKPSKGA